VVGGNLRRARPCLPELNCHSAPAKLKQRLLRITAHVQDDAVFVAHQYTAHATGQIKSGFTRQISAFELGNVGEVVNFSDCARFGDPNID
jgi:hypothetical protein